MVPHYILTGTPERSFNAADRHCPKLGSSGRPRKYRENSIRALYDTMVTISISSCWFSRWTKTESFLSLQQQVGHDSSATKAANGQLWDALRQKGPIKHDAA